MHRIHPLSFPALAQQAENPSPLQNSLLFFLPGNIRQQSYVLFGPCFKIEKQKIENCISVHEISIWKVLFKVNIFYMYNGVAPSTYFMLSIFSWAAEVSLGIQVLFKVVLNKVALSCDSYKIMQSHQNINDIPCLCFRSILNSYFPVYRITFPIIRGLWVIFSEYKYTHPFNIY